MPGPIFRIGIWGVAVVFAAAAFAQTQESEPVAESKPGRVRMGFEGAGTIPVSGQAGLSEERPDSSAPAGNARREQKRGQLVGAPIPLSNPFLGSGLGLIAGYVMRLNPRDEVSPPSVFGAGGLYTNNGTWGAVGAAKLYFKQDRYRTTLVAGKGNFNYDLYGIGQEAGALGTSVPINQTGSILFFEGMRRLTGRFFLGPRYQIRSITLNLDREPSSVPPSIPLGDVGMRQQTAALGIVMQNDSRNSQFYPTTGGRFRFSTDLFRQSVGSDRNYERYQFEFQRNPALSRRQVFAYRLYGCAVGGPVPVYDLCLYGMDNDIRGYSTGRYRDRRMFATQGEYRLELPKRFGLVAFAGFGGVAPSLGQFRADSLLPAGGVGLRFKVDPGNHINLRFDYAVGKDGGAYYVGIAEAF